MLFKMAVLGAGFMGKVHAANISKISQAKLTAVCDANINAAQELGNQYHATAYTDFNGMLEREKPDAVVICLPPFAHNGEVAVAAARGVHIFIEKPIHISAGKAKDMVAAVTAAGVKTQVGYHCRFGGAVIELKKRIESGQAGRPVLFNGRYECNSLHGEWWRDKSKCGSQMLEQAIHTYDMGMYLMGEPVSVNGLMNNLCHKNTERYTLEDVSGALIQYDSGAIGTITATNCAVPGRWNNPFSVVFEKLTANFYNPNHAVFVETTGGEVAEQVIQCGNDMYFDEMMAFIELLQGKRESACPIAEGYASLRLVTDAMDSAEKGGQLIECERKGNA